MIQKIISFIRKITPLSLRKNIGPYIGYISYKINLYTKTPPAKILSVEETLDVIKKDNLSAVRFGDGEMSLINDSDLGFQKKNIELAHRLKEILQTNNSRLLVCVLDIFGKLEMYEKKAFWFEIHHLFKLGHVWRALLNPSQIYGNAFITRPYLLFKDKKNSGMLFKKIFSLWESRDVILIEGEKSRLGVGNDMFNNTKSIGRILCPAENAYDVYKKIKEETLKIDKNKLILLSLGPTAKVLTFDLFKLGYQVIDIGHIDMEYEMFLRKENDIVKVKYKYFNEIGERNPEDCTDESYARQIIAKIV